MVMMIVIMIIIMIMLVGGWRGHGG